MSENPFPGPQPYRAADRSRFFARDAFVKKLANQVLARSATTVFGPSGAGKSSLMQAGVIPVLQDSDDVRVVRVDAWPANEAPLPWLVSQIFIDFRLGPVPEGKTSLETLEEAIDLTGRRSDRSILIYLDQIEQLFVAERAPDEMQALLQGLAWLIHTDREQDVHVVLSLREDYLGRLRDWTRERPELSAHGFRVAPLSVGEMVKAMCRTAKEGDPAQDWNHDEIRSLMLDVRVLGQSAVDAAEVQTAFGQIVCRALWDERAAGRDVRGADAESILQRYLDTTLAGLGALQESAQKLLEEHLIDDEGHRRLLTEKEARLVLRSSQAIEVLDKLDAARVLRAEEHQGSRYFELGHDWLAKKVLERRVERKARAARRRIAAIAVIVMAIIATLGGTLWWALVQKKEADAQRELAEAARQQVRWAQQFGEDAKEMDLFLRAAYALPVHDVERERNVVRDRLKDIQQRMTAAGTAGEGPGNYAMGRGYLALGDPGQARRYLEKASNAGYVSAELHYALGLAYGELFRRAIDDAKRTTTNEDQWEKKTAELQNNLRAPALAHLRAALSARIEVPTYAEGLIALYEGKHDEAAEKAKATFERAPWMYESKKLEGDALFAEGRKYGHDAGFDYDKMKPYFDRAAAAYRAASDIGRSDPETYRAECELWERMGLAADMKGALSRDPFETANAACTHAVQSSSKDGKSRISRAQVMASHLRIQIDEDIPLDEKLRLADDAVKIARDAADASPGEVMAHYTMAVVQQMRTQMLQTLGKESTMKEAIESLKHALAIDPRFILALIELGEAYAFDADTEEQNGRDPIVMRRNSIHYFNQALSVDPKFSLAAGRKLVNYRKLLEYEIEHGREDPDALQEMIDCAAYYEKTEPGPWQVAYWNVRTNVLHASYENAFGRSPDIPLKIALDSIVAFAGQVPDDSWFLQALVECRWIGATHALRSGKEPLDIIEETRRVIKKVTQIEKTFPEELRVLAARIEVVAIRAANVHGTLRTEHFERALRYIEPDIQRTGAFPRLDGIHAEILSLRAQWAAETKMGKPAEDVARGLDSAAKALLKNPRMVQALIAKAQLLLVQSHLVRSDVERAEIARRAKEAFSVAFRENPLLEREYSHSVKEILAIVP